MESTYSLSSYFLFFLLASAALLEAHIADFDESWQKRAVIAREKAHEAYTADPESVTNSFNAEVEQDLERNNTRRMLRRKYWKRSGLCQATNPIDRCWRCRKNWYHHRKLLATCAKGFGHATTGGAKGNYYVVTDASDDDLVNPRPGTLRYGVIQGEPLWIVFERDMIIRLSEELMINGNKTIDGRGAQVHIANGGGLMIQFVQNVIIHNLHIHDIKSGGGGMIRDTPSHYGLRKRSDGDGISIFGASQIWIDHVSMYRCMDGIIDAIEGSTAITISNSHFTNHNEVMLFGAHDSDSDDKIMQITLAFNHFGKGLIQRMPRVRWGFVHIVNNDYTHWQMYAVGGSQHPTIISQGNRYIAPPNYPNAKEVTKRTCDTPQSEWQNWVWKSEGDEFCNGAFFVESGPANTQKFTKTQMIKFKPASSVKRLVRYAGTLPCKPGVPC